MVANAMSDDGDISSFVKNWENRPELSYLHWSPDQPKNQIQLAFRRHWLTFSSILGPQIKPGKCLEVGCGRGSLSAYFADAGWDCTLLDISDSVLARARQAFSDSGLSTPNIINSDCRDIHLDSNYYDVIFSIGLLEHFEDCQRVISEQFRCLAPGGTLFAYVVPEKEVIVQRQYDWINLILKSEIFFW